jgi:hypothetical protein
MKSLALIFVLFAVILMGFISCQKTEKLIEADIELISPAENLLIYLPDTLQIKFRINTEEEIESVDIRIVNSNYISLFGTNTVHAPITSEEMETTLLLRSLQDFDDAPYYIRLTVNYKEGNQNSYFKIQLANKALAYQGFFLFSKSDIHQTNIVFYDQCLNHTDFLRSSGDYLNSEISGFYRKLYMLTEIPAKLKTFSINNQQLEWETEPTFPNPEFTNISIDEDRIYAGMQSGQIVGYSQQNGQPKLITEILTDYFPEKVFILVDFIIGDFLSRMNGKNTLVTFYKETGVKKHKLPIDCQVVSFAMTAYPEQVLVIGNKNQKGIINLYHVNDNYIVSSQQVDEGIITDVCEINIDAMLFTIGKHIYLHHYKQNITSDLVAFEEAPVQIHFERISQQIIVQFEHKLTFLPCPGMEEITTMNFNETLKGLQFYYQYE